MSTEAQAYLSIPEPVLLPNQFELSTPRDENGERIGVGAIMEKRDGRQLKPGERTILQAVFHSIIRYGRPIQEPPDAKERQHSKMSSHSYRSNRNQGK